MRLKSGQGGTKSTSRGGVRRAGNSFLGDTLANFKRWLLKFIRSPHVIAMNLLQPILFLFLFTEVFGGVVGGPMGRAIGGSIDYVTFLLPAIAIQVALMTGQGGGIGLVMDIEEWIFEKVMVSPMGTTAVFLGKTFSELVRIAIQIGIILGLGVLLGAEITTGFPGALGVIGIGVLFSLLFISLTTAVAMVTKDQEAMMSIMIPVMFPLLFLSSAFLPLNALPGWVQTFAKFNPVTYGVDAARAVVLGKDVMEVVNVTCFSGIWNTIIPALGVLLAFAVVLGGLAVFSIRRGTSTDVE
ncbi:ABC transporter [candidate division MSBL1 archaeon SCGC-AAA259O05]|uniref:ABC transporter n=1 Tax=candidate division MSBL1 archaeon SCGC-AAA259O05 TaxID=1698271 RepID=A0A133V528_9EURY|nr:ABC transporter [candidate division MSBL1 archaeon SCGC-AAA259O05]